MTRVKSAKLFASNRRTKFQLDEFRVRFRGLPADAPDQPVTTIAIECESEPVQNTELIRKQNHEPEFDTRTP